MRKKIVYAASLAFGLLSLIFQTALGDDGLLAEPSNSGIYFGGQLGTSKLHYDGSSYTNSKSHYDRHRLLAGRVFVGYAFSQFIAAELGYDYYGYPKFKHNDNNNTQDLLQHGLDLVAKANLPLNYGFSFYAKAGLTLIHRGTLNNNSGTFEQKNSNNKVTPVGALGVSYQFAPNIAMDLSWTKTMHISDLPSTDLFGVGFTYKINF